MQLIEHNLPKSIERIANARPMRNGSGRLRCVVANEHPRWREDGYTGEPYAEILLMEGCEFRGESRQVPLVDGSNVESVRNIFGSVRRLRVEHFELIGELEFASDATSQMIFRRMDEGHISDVELSVQPRELLSLKAGERYRTVSGPCRLITRWSPLTVGLVATGSALGMER